MRCAHERDGLASKALISPPRLSLSFGRVVLKHKYAPMRFRAAGCRNLPTDFAQRSDDELKIVERMPME